MSETQAPQVATKTPFEYTGELTIAVDVADLDRAIEWYRQAFGFELIYKLDDYKWCELATTMPGINVGLGEGEERRAGGITPTFVVRDIDAARRHLESAGAPFDGDTREIPGMVKLANFTDPDGNTFGLAQGLV